MTISVGSPELDAIADRVAAEYAAEKAAAARFEAEIAEAKRGQVEIVKNRGAAKIALGICLAAVAGGFLAPSNYWGSMIGSAALVIGAIIAIWIYDSLGREGRWLRQEELAREGLRRWQQTLAAREISN
ncbi:hypothetical protein ABID65_000371 [Bradyrhizobium sp. S3.9.2]|uniref:hypothetical protein n=1 Tax=Bradyrhizobium sp. S3.9.2 TaxID=3156432 RepID=UPI003396A6FE